MERFTSELYEYDGDDQRLLEMYFANVFLANANKQIIHLPVDFFEHLNLENEINLKIFGMGKSLRIAKWEDEMLNTDMFLNSFDNL